MISAVLLFGMLNCVFEFVLLSFVSPRWRCRALGSPGVCAALHITMLSLNLAIHWGTLIGSMSAILAFCASIATVAISRWLFGTVRGGIYTRGLIKYNAAELT